MKRLVNNISVLSMAFFVMLLSIGLNISKMKCATDGHFYFGTEVPSCSIQTELICEAQKEDMSCCMKDIVESCCPETNDESCASETENMHFDFETLISESEFVLKDFLIVSAISHLTDKFQTHYLSFSYLSGIPPPQFKKSIFLQIQSFLL